VWARRIRAGATPPVDFQVGQRREGDRGHERLAHRLRAGGRLGKRVAAAPARAGPLGDVCSTRCANSCPAEAAAVTGGGAATTMTGVAPVAPPRRSRRPAGATARDARPTHPPLQGPDQWADRAGRGSQTCGDGGRRRRGHGQPWQARRRIVGLRGHGRHEFIEGLRITPRPAGAGGPSWRRGAEAQRSRAARGARSAA